MKKILTVFLCMLMSISMATAATPKKKQVVTKTYLTNIACQNCVNKIMKNMKNVSIKFLTICFQTCPSVRLARANCASQYNIPSH